MRRPGFQRLTGANMVSSSGAAQNAVNNDGDYNGLDSGTQALCSNVKLPSACGSSILPTANITVWQWL